MFAEGMTVEHRGLDARGVVVHLDPTLKWSETDVAPGEVPVLWAHNGRVIGAHPDNLVLVSRL